MSPKTETPIVLSDMDVVTSATGQCDCNCDCACSRETVHTYSQAEHLTAALMAGTRRFHRAQPSYTLRLDDQHVVAYSPAHRLAVLNRAASAILADFEPAFERSMVGSQRQATWGDNQVQTTITQMLLLGLLVPDNMAAPTTANDSTLVAWLHVTDRCNLRCAYCYLPHLPTDMAYETGCAAIDATLRSAVNHDFTRVRLKYAGGEALLRLTLVADLHRYACNQAHEQSLDLEGVILSNGTLLTDKTLKQIRALGLRLMLSLDGLGAQHDHQRPFADGRGSALAVTQAVDRALDLGVVPHISITVSGASADGLPTLLEWVLDRQLPFNLNFYRENDCSISTADLRLDQESFIVAMLAAYKVIEARLPRRSLLGSLVDLADLSSPRLRPCGVGQNYLVFDENGNVAKCQMQMNCIVSDMHDDDPLERVRSDRLGILNLPVEAKTECSTCEWKNWCAGGCPLATYRSTHHYDRKSPNCNIYRALYPAVVRLEGLRLLAKAQ